MTQDFFVYWSIFALLTVIIAFFVLDAHFFSLVGTLLLLSSLLVVLRIAQLVYKRIESKKHDYAQIEALFSLYHHLQPGVHLPRMRSYSGSPDFLNLIVEALKKNQPKVIVEASSGISSLVISEWLLKHAPNSKHYALENDLNYAEITRSRVRNPNSQIIHAPIKQHQIEGNDWKYYSLEDLEAVKDIDMLIIDGPSWRLQHLARYPALPLLKDKLADEYVVILDDAIREAEQEIAKKWQHELGLELEHFPLEKGAFVLKKSGSS